jgi:hypothetical protein
VARARAFLAVPAVALVAAAAGCGGSSGLDVGGVTPDAKEAAKRLVATVDTEADGVTAVACGELDFAGTYRCTISSETTPRVCAVPAAEGTPTCISREENVAEAARRDELVGKALEVAREQGRLAAIVKGMREGNFTIGCTLGFRTVRDGAAQTDDVVVGLIVVATETGRSFWAALTITPAGDITEKTGVDPSEKPPVNGYGGCDLDEDGVASAQREHRDTSLLPSA